MHAKKHFKPCGFSALHMWPSCSCCDMVKPAGFTFEIYASHVVVYLSIFCFEVKLWYRVHSSCHWVLAAWELSCRQQCHPCLVSLLPGHGGWHWTHGICLRPENGMAGSGVCPTLLLVGSTGSLALVYATCICVLVTKIFCFIKLVYRYGYTTKYVWWSKTLHKLD